MRKFIIIALVSILFISCYDNPNQGLSYYENDSGVKYKTLQIPSENGKYTLVINNITKGMNRIGMTLAVYSRDKKVYECTDTKIIMEICSILNDGELNFSFDSTQVVFGKNAFISDLLK